jgi:hypothetical protein
MTEIYHLIVRDARSLKVLGRLVSPEAFPSLADGLLAVVSHGLSFVLTPLVSLRVSKFPPTGTPVRLD